MDLPSVAPESAAAVPAPSGAGAAVPPASSASFPVVSGSAPVSPVGPASPVLPVSSVPASSAAKPILLELLPDDVLRHLVQFLRYDKEYTSSYPPVDHGLWYLIELLRKRYHAKKCSGSRHVACVFLKSFTFRYFLDLATSRAVNLILFLLRNGAAAGGAAPVDTEDRIGTDGYTALPLELKSVSNRVGASGELVEVARNSGEYYVSEMESEDGRGLRILWVVDGTIRRELPVVDGHGVSQGAAVLELITDRRWFYACINRMAEVNQRRATSPLVDLHQVPDCDSSTLLSDCAWGLDFCDVDHGLDPKHFTTLARKWVVENVKRHLARKDEGGPLLFDELDSINNLDTFLFHADTEFDRTDIAWHFRRLFEKKIRESPLDSDLFSDEFRYVVDDADWWGDQWGFHLKHFYERYAEREQRNGIVTAYRGRGRSLSYVFYDIFQRLAGWPDIEDLQSLRLVSWLREVFGLFIGCFIRGEGHTLNCLLRSQSSGDRFHAVMSSFVKAVIKVRNFMPAFPRTIVGALFEFEANGTTYSFDVPGFVALFDADFRRFYNRQQNHLGEPSVSPWPNPNNSNGRISPPSIISTAYPWMEDMLKYEDDFFPNTNIDDLRDFRRWLRIEIERASQFEFENRPALTRWESVRESEALGRTEGGGNGANQNDVGDEGGMRGAAGGTG